MAKPVGKIPTVAGSRDDRPARRVDRFAGDARPDGGGSGEMRPQDGLVNRALLFGRRADKESAGHVRAVALIAAAEIEHDRIALLDDAGSGAEMCIRDRIVILV